MNICFCIMCGFSSHPKHTHEFRWVAIRQLEPNNENEVEFYFDKSDCLLSWLGMDRKHQDNHIRQLFSALDKIKDQMIIEDLKE